MGSLYGILNLFKGFSYYVWYKMLILFIREVYFFAYKQYLWGFVWDDITRFSDRRIRICNLIQPVITQ